jgi:hypothetical protein
MPAVLGNVQARLIDCFFYAQERKMSLFPSFGTPQHRSAGVSPRVPLDTSVCASTAAALADSLLHEGHKPVAACSTPGPCLLESWRSTAPPRSCCLY